MSLPGRPQVAPSAHIVAKRQRRRAEVLLAALRAFRQNGYHATTLDDIAERLGIRKTALYHYFPDKDAILYACHDNALARLERIAGEALARSSRAADQLTHVIREHVRVMTDTLDASPLAFEVTSLSPEYRQRVIAGRDRYEQVLREIIERGVRQGAFRRVDTKVAAFAILGAINWVARWYRPEGSLNAADIGAQFADHLVRGLRVRPL